MSRLSNPAMLGLSALVIGLILAAAVVEFDAPQTESRVERQVERARHSEPILPLEPIEGLDPKVVSLGRRLFHETRLSGDGKIACATCHVLPEGGDDGLTTGKGIGGQTGHLNVPTVLNAALNFRQFWDGRATTLEEQAAGPISDPNEMGGNWDDILAYLRSEDSYVRAFKRAFSGGKISKRYVLRAIADFERSLVTVDSPFDRYLRGDESQLSPAAVRGYQLFKERGCIACHQGRNVGGNLFQRFGVFGDYFADRGELNDADLGRYNVTGEERDRHVFKVPSLRNVERTGPYLHDGSAATLEDAVRVMARYQLGQELPDDEVAGLVAFLKSLTGETPQ